MGRKLKTGKQRKDRYYHLAKETGYRSRAAFKLIQINRKFEFLQRSKVLIDLCAAPGGWLQVANKYMPVSSVVVGVDLVPIKPIHNVITLQDDIMTHHCRQQLRKELQTWKADVVLHDGAPNVGKTWLHDAYNQNRLTLSALSVAAEFLIKGGWFITKVFRSKDYNALMWTFKKLFQKVHSTKPQASRSESAEIFVICQNFISPDKIDPKFFDPSFVFADVDQTLSSEKKNKANLLKPANKIKKAKAEGYVEGDYLQHTMLNATDFIKNINHIELLSNCHEIIIDSEEIKNHALTTDEIIECCKDIKVLGRKEILSLIAWRKKLKADLFKEEKPTRKIDGKEVDESVISETDEIDDHLNEEERDAKRKKRKILKERRKLNERMNLKMVLKNDQLVEEESELFRLKTIKNKKQLNQMEEIDLNEVEIDFADETNEYETDLQTNTVYYDKDDEELEFSSDESDNTGDKFDKDVDGNLVPISDLNIESEEENDLVVSLEGKEAKRDKVNMFFDAKVFHEESDENDDELELELIEEKLQKADKTKSGSLRKVKENGKRQTNDDERSEDEEEENQQKDIANEKCKKKVKLSPEELALGTLMIRSQKTKRDILDNAWNRYTHGDDEFAPSWLRKDEEKHFRKPLPVTEDMVKDYKQQLREINARPIKKVAEAKARKKKKAIRKLEKARKRAEHITNAADMTEREKSDHIKNVYKRALKDNKKEVKYVVAKKHLGKRRPPGVKGRYKVVDPRMKKDNRKVKNDTKNKNHSKNKSAPKNKNRKQNSTKRKR